MNQKITFPELIELLARKQKCSKRDAENFLRELVQLMTDVVSSGESLRINSLGTFKSVWVEARASVNVQTGEPYLIPGHYKLSFTPTKQVRDIINEPFACFTVEVLPDDAPILQENFDEMATQEEPEQIVAVECEVTDEENKVVELPQEERDEEMAQEGIQAPIEEVAEVEKTDEIERETVLPEIDEVVQKSEEQPATEEKTDVVEEAESEITQNIEEYSPSTEIIDETVEEEVQSHPDAKVDVADENEPQNALYEETNTEENKSSYRKGLWTGIFVATTIFAVAMLLLYLYFTRYSEYAMKNEPQQVVATDTVHDTSIVVDTVPTVQDALAVDTNVLEDEVLPTQTVYTTQVDTIRSGVFLTNISLRHYGHKAFWVYIYEENKDIISNPDLIPIGTVVTIPPAEKYGINPSDTVAVNKALAIAREIKEQRNK